MCRLRLAMSLQDSHDSVPTFLGKGCQSDNFKIRLPLRLISFAGIISHFLLTVDAKWRGACWYKTFWVNNSTWLRARSFSSKSAALAWKCSIEVVAAVYSCILKGKLFLDFLICYFFFLSFVFRLYIQGALFYHLGAPLYGYYLVTSKRLYHRRSFICEGFR